jgi:hypothetical protein
MINNWYLLFIRTEGNFMKQIGSVNLISGKRFYHSNIESYGLNENDLYYLGNDQEYHKLK